MSIVAGITKVTVSGVLPPSPPDPVHVASLTQFLVYAGGDGQWECTDICAKEDEAEQCAAGCRAENEVACIVRVDLPAWEQPK